MNYDEIELREFLIRVDAWTSLIVSRYKHTPLDEDIIEELQKLSSEARRMYE